MRPEFIPFFVILPLAGAFLIPVIGRLSPSFSRATTFMIFLILTSMCLWTILSWDRSVIVYYVGGWEPVNDIPVGINLVFDGLSAFILGIISFIALLVSIYSIGYMKAYTAGNNFYALFCLMVAGMNGVVLTGDLFNLFVFLEIAAIASYALVAFGVEKEELEASFKYMVLGGLASSLILLGIGLTYWSTGTLNMADCAAVLKDQAGYQLILFIQVLFIAGFGLKAAVVPFHAWLPDAHSSAPSPISSMLSGILIKAIGIYVLIRLFFNVFALSEQVAVVITALGVLSIIVGGIMALGQWDYKRLLAYSSISQVGYILLGFGVGLMVLANQGSQTVAALAIFGGLFHLINHAVFKSLMFMVAGSVEYSTNIRDLRKLGGLGSLMPITSGSSFSGSMSISGLPPFSGFFSKLIIIVAAVQAQYYVIAFIAAAMSVVTLAYFLKLQKNIFTSVSRTDFSAIKKVPVTMLVPMVALSVLCLILSVLIFPEIRDFALEPAVNALTGIIN